jgi:hypothetical protein
VIAGPIRRRCLRPDEDPSCPKAFEGLCESFGVGDGTTGRIVSSWCEPSVDFAPNFKIPRAFAN